MSLEEEVEVVDRRDATINHGPSTWVAVIVGSSRICRIEASVMALASNALIMKGELVQAEN